MAHAVDTALIRITRDVARIKFDGVREERLMPTHKNVRKAIAAATKEMGQPMSVRDLATDWFNGHPFLVWGLMAPFVVGAKTLSVDDASDLIDQYLKNGGTSQELQNALVTILATYLNVEVVKQTVEGDDVPNADTPDQPGPSAG